MIQGTVLITGATSGIGEAYARHFASKGHDLILTGRRRDKLNRLQKELSGAFRIGVRLVFADFTRMEDIGKIVDIIRKEDRIEVLVNNAGFGNKKPFGEGGLEEQTAMILAHELASARFAHAVLPGMRRRKKGAIINVASMAAFMPSSIDSMYCATKSFLLTFSESLHMRFRKSGIRIQALCPGFIKTDFHARLGPQPRGMKDNGLIKWQDPASVVKTSIGYLKRDIPVCVPGFWYRVVLALVRFMPRGFYYRFAGKY